MGSTDDELDNVELLKLLKLEVLKYNNQVWRRHIDTNNNITYLWHGVRYSSYDKMWSAIDKGDA